ncbi:MAG: FAD-dependent oxidoreductase [Candidatus Bathyarchaeia archaeon]
MENSNYERAQVLATAEATTHEEIRRLLNIEKLKHCFECGICTASCSMAELLGEDYNPRGLLGKIFLNAEDALSSHELWLCAWCYKCYRRCPQALEVPEIFLVMRTIAVKRGCLNPIEKALQKVARNVPLPLVVTLVCLHPERVGLNIQDILEKIRDKRTKPKTRKALKDDECKVAVLGSGPAGLTVAYELVQRGYPITVFESLPELGGMLRKCIPEHRLPRDILEEELCFLSNLGVEFKVNVHVGKDLSFNSLWDKSYKAIFVGVGAHKSQKLKIEGEDLEGVVNALDFLWRVKNGVNVALGKNVAVIGGGNVAVDAARTALELGAENVTIFYRRSKAEMPANPWEVKEAEGTGVKMEFLTAPKRILGEDGRISAIEFIRMKLGELDESGRRKPLPIEGSEFVFKADTVILAIGETPDLEFLPKDVVLNEDGTIWVNPITMETSMRGVFAGGDVVTGPASVIEAICAGKRAANSIDRYLKAEGA